MLRLKENPVEWIKFTAVIGLAVNVVCWLLWIRHRIPLPVPIATTTIAIAMLLTAMARPRWFRGFYRGGMTVSFHVGQVIGKIMLTLMFFLIVTPMGLLLRVTGKDILKIRKGSEGESWWQHSSNSRDFDRMF